MGSESVPWIADRRKEKIELDLFMFLFSFQNGSLYQVLLFVFQIKRPTIPIDIPKAHECDSVLDKSESLRRGESLTWYVNLGSKNWYKVVIRGA